MKRTRMHYNQLKLPTNHDVAISTDIMTKMKEAQTKQKQFIVHFSVIRVFTWCMHAVNSVVDPYRSELAGCLKRGRTRKQYRQ